MGRAQRVRQLELLRDDLLRLGSMVEYALTNAMHSLETWDTVAATQVLDNDVHIDAARTAAELQVIALIAHEQLAEKDPPLLMAAFAIASELERIGDYACTIARRAKRLTQQAALVPPPPLLREMVMISERMLNTSLEAFLRQDDNLVRTLRADEERVDWLETRLRTELLALALAEPQRVEAVIALLDVVHAVERVADRATNIGERVIYLVTNSTEELNP